jgi:NADPH2:quinone reductase
MKAVRVVRHGDPREVVEVGDVEEPDPGPGEVRVAVGAASINFGDIARARGGVASVTGVPPFTLGMDVCGIVDRAGEGAEGWLGRRVVAVAKQSLGGMAEFAIAPTTGVFDAPPELDDAEAAAFLLPFHTGYLALHERARLQPGEVLLVVGGASGVGTAVIQLGVAAGARVIAVAGGPDKGKLGTSLGAEAAIDHHTEDVFEQVMALTGDHGADVACDMVGGQQTELIWSCMAHGGRYVPVGFNDDEQSGLTGRPLRKVSTGNFSVVGVVMAYAEVPVEFRRFGLNPFPPATGPRVHAALRALVTEGRIRPTIGRRISMAQVAEALEDHAARRTSGRTVVEIVPVDVSR